MIVKTDWLVRFYKRILRFYPSNFRHEYQQEMLSVFEMQIAGAQPVSFWETLNIFWRELRDFPAGLASAYLRERKKNLMSSKLDRMYSLPQGSWKELVLAGLPLILYALVPAILSLIPAIEKIPDPIGLVIFAVFAVTLIGIGIVGLLARLPRWSMIYSGILLTLLAYIFMFSLNALGLLPFGDAWTTGTTTSALAIFLVILFALLAVMILAAGQLRLTASWSKSIRADRTLLPFMLYGGSFVFVVLSYDEVGKSIFPLLSALAMLAGIGGYLRAGSVNGRLRSLFIGNTLALVSALAANLLYSVLPTEILFRIGTIAIDRLAVSVFLIWFTNQVMIFLPLLIKLPSNPATSLLAGD
jgi:hypothetical protein